MLYSALFLPLLLAPAANAGPSCLDESGREVDWWIVLKHNRGFDYSYLDSSSHSSFKASQYTLDQTDDGAVVRTLLQAYDGAARLLNSTEFKLSPASLNSTRKNLSSTTDSLAWAFYNDEHPDGHKSSYDAHSKGVIAFDGTSGFWLVHSMPKWPQGTDKGYDILPDDKFGQAMFCMSLATKAFDGIGQQQQMTRPYMYDSNLPDSLASKVPGFADWLDGKKMDDDSYVLDLKVGRSTFKHAAKSKASGFDLYEDVVAPELDSNLWVETWQNGGGNLGPFCKSDGDKYEVTDVQEVDVNGASWDINQDHSKWAVSQDGQGNWVCVGDINRQTSQEKRAGGTVCQENSSLHGAFLKIIKSHDSC